MNTTPLSAAVRTLPVLLTRYNDGDFSVSLCKSVDHAQAKLAVKAIEDPKEWSHAVVEIPVPGLLCIHDEVEILENHPLEGETYGDLRGQCRCCGCYVKAYGMIEETPGRLEPRGPWEIDQEAMQEVL